MRALKFAGIIAAILIIVYLAGPRPQQPRLNPQLPKITVTGAALDSLITENEQTQQIKPGNEAKIIWFDSLERPTEYAVVYLHGFSASHEEGNPVHINFAKRYGCNLYLSRLYGHGINTSEPLAELTADKLWESAKNAFAIGKAIGKKVILMATSTGASLALKLASLYPEIHALILLSPNIEINDPNAWLLNNPWGLQIARLVKGRYNTASDTSEIYSRFWYYNYRMEGAVQLQELLETTMKEAVFSKIHQPVLMLYYYKDEDQQDQVVKVSAMKRMFRQLASPDSIKRAIAVPEAGDHVIGSHIKSKDIAAVERACRAFAEEVLGW